MMKTIKAITVCIVFLGLVFSNACGNSGGSSDDKKTYWIINFTNNEPYQITTELRAENAIVKIFVDVNATSVSQSDIDYLAGEFLSNIYLKVKTNFAVPYDVDGNGKVKIIILDLLDNYETTGAYVGGYFYPVDMFSQSDVDTYAPGKKSNEGDIVYIDCYPQNLSTEAAGTIAHELQHMANFSNTLLTRKSAPTDTWIDEGFSEAASHMCYGENTNRITYFNNSSTIQDGQSLFYWDETDTQKNLMNYSLSYLFFQYLRSQSAKKDAIFKDILNTTESVVDYKAIEQAMAGDANFAVDANWKCAGSRFNTLLLRWYATNTSEIGNSSFYSYDSEITTAPDLPLYTGINVTLGSGAGVVKGMNTSTAVSSTGYVYLSVNYNGSSEDFIPSYYNYDYFVAVYANYNTTVSTSGTSDLPAGNLIPGDEISAKSSSVKESTCDKPMMIDPVLKNSFPLLKDKALELVQ